MSWAELRIMHLTCSALRLGFTDKISDAVPVTIGAANEVPLARK
jgi:hypothetical protein